jgi:16S rRNA (guanine966-N2)-methyltransferase
VQAVDALAFLRDAPPEPFDIVFVDPPFDAALWDTAAARLGPWLAPGAWVYVEAPAGAAPARAADWQPHRHGATRDVQYALFRTPAAGPAATLPAEPPPQGDTPA